MSQYIVVSYWSDYDFVYQQQVSETESQGIRDREAATRFESPDAAEAFARRLRGGSPEFVGESVAVERV